MTMLSSVIVLLTCNHASHDKSIGRRSSYGGESEAAASLKAVHAGWLFLGPASEGTERKHWCPHCARRERAAGNI